MRQPPNLQLLFIVLLVLYCSHWALNHDGGGTDRILAPGLAHKAYL